MPKYKLTPSDDDAINYNTIQTQQSRQDDTVAISKRDNNSDISSAFRMVYDDEEADIIQSNYEKFAKRAGISPADVKSHVLNGYGMVFSPYNQQNSFLVGTFIGRTFCVSHFAPENMKEGISILLDLLHSSTPAVFAVPPRLADQLVKVGYKRIFKGVPMQFRWEVMDKDICVNYSIDKHDLLILLGDWMDKAKSSSLLSDEPRVQQFLSLLNRVKSKLLREVK